MECGGCGEKATGAGGADNQSPPVREAPTPRQSGDVSQKATSWGVSHTRRKGVEMRTEKKALGFMVPQRLFLGTKIQRKWFLDSLQ